MPDPAPKKSSSERIAIVDGIRTPFCRGGGVLRDMEPDDIGAYIVSELIARTGIDPSKVDELVFGNVIQPAASANIARIIAIKGGLPIKTPAYTVNRNCASGLEAIVNGADKISLGRDDIVIAGGTESMSNFPVTVKKNYKEFLQRFMKAKTWKERLGILCTFRPGMLIPEIPEISDPLCSLNMGQTAEVLAREFKIDQMEQDRFALASQTRAAKAVADGVFSGEVIPMPIPPTYGTVQMTDDGVRTGQTLEALNKLKPAFDKFAGTVTAGNSSQVTDGAAAVLLMRESQAKAMGYTPLGYIRDYAEVGLQPNRMGMGPAYAITKLLDNTGLTLKDIDLIEINEAFAVQVLACIKALASDTFAKEHLGRDKAVGQIDLEKLNVNGGAIALGHPLGASGTRLVITLLRELKRRNKNIGIASLCIGGGQGQAILLEVK